MKNLSETIKNTKNNGNVGELKGILTAARRTGAPVAILPIPTYLLAIDERYQTPMRTERELGYLIRNFDERKLLPLQGVPHDEEGLIYLTDGYGRWKATEIINPEKYSELNVMVILNAPTEPQARLEFEAEQYAFQNKCVAKITPIQKHGALRVMKDSAVLAMDELQAKYGFEYVATQGKRSENVLGSYTECIAICKTRGKACMDWIFEICQKSGFDRKGNGYATNIMRALRDLWTLYETYRTPIKREIIKYLRGITPAMLKARGCTKYPLLDFKAACSLFLEDYVVETLDVTQKRKADKNRLLTIKVA